MRRNRAWLRAFEPFRLLDDCAALMLIEAGEETEHELLHALDARPPLARRIALRIVLRRIRRATR